MQRLIHNVQDTKEYEFFLFEGILLLLVGGFGILLMDTRTPYVFHYRGSDVAEQLLHATLGQHSLRERMNG